MEQCYRIAFWMFCVIVCLQARPTPLQCPLPTPHDLSLDLLEHITCGNVKFLSPSMNEANKSVAINCIYMELEEAADKCTDSFRIDSTLDSLVDLKNCSQSAATPSSDCPWPETQRKTFKDFVKDIRRFFEELETERKTQTTLTQ